VKFVGRALIIASAFAATTASANADPTDLELYEAAYWAGNPAFACYSTDSEGSYWEKLNRRLSYRLITLREMLAAKFGNESVAKVEHAPGEVFFNGRCNPEDTYRSVAEFERRVRKLEHRLKKSGAA
jgi:hypothetical protein